MNKKENFEFYGLFLGYVVSLLICWIIHGRTVKVTLLILRNFTSAANTPIGQWLDYPLSQDPDFTSKAILTCPNHRTVNRD